MNEFDAANVAVYALSYDEADALRDFRAAHGISYTLLSDPNSEVIRAFGILNTLIDANDHPWFGIPYPGTYVVSADGDIIHKFFDNNLAVRAGAAQLLRAAVGQATVHSDEVAPGSIEEVEEVEVSVRLEGDSLSPTVLRDLVARFRVPAGRHVYALPAPAGSIAVDIVLDDSDRLVQRPVIRPQADAHQLAGTDETFEVHHDLFELRLPLTVNSASEPEITISGALVWQTCDDQVCDIPVRRRFELTVPVTSSPPVALGSRKGAALEPNALAHFARMSERRKQGRTE